MDDSIRCPQGSRYKGDAVGCGSLNVYGPDDDGYYDCLDCGLFFRDPAFLRRCGQLLLEATLLADDRYDVTITRLPRNPLEERKTWTIPVALPAAYEGPVDGPDAISCVCHAALSFLEDEEPLDDGEHNGWGWVLRPGTL